MQRNDETALSALLSLPVTLALVSMLAFFYTIVVPDRALLSVIGSEKPGKNSVEVLKEAKKLKPWILMEKQNLVGAVQETQTMLHQSPNDVAAAYCAAVVYEKSNNLDDAFKQIKRALSLAPLNLDLRLEYARMLVDANKIDDAIAQYRLVIKQVPKETGPRLDLAQLFMVTDRPAEAAKELEDLLVVAPNDVVAHKIRGIALCRAGRGQEGMDEYLAGVATEHGTGKSEGIKFILSLYGDLNKGKYALEQQAQRSPDDPLPKLRLAQLCLYENRPSEAKSYLMEARKVASGSPELQAEIYRSLCVSYKRLGDNGQALTAFMESVALEQKQAKRNQKNLGK